MNVCCSGCSAGVSLRPFLRAYQAGKPSSVVMGRSATVATGVTQERISLSSAGTVQAQLIRQDVEQGRIRARRHGPCLAVDGNLEIASHALPPAESVFKGN